MMDLFGYVPSPEYPNAPGHRGVETSIEAAEAMQPRVGRLQRLTLDAIRSAGAPGLTFEEAANSLQLDFRSIQPRVSELKEKGLVVDSGLRRRNASGKRAIVWTMPRFKQEAPHD